MYIQLLQKTYIKTKSRTRARSFKNSFKAIFRTQREIKMNNFPGRNYAQKERNPPSYSWQSATNVYPDKLFRLIRWHARHSKPQQSKQTARFWTPAHTRAEGLHKFYTHASSVLQHHPLIYTRYIGRQLISKASDFWPAAAGIEAIRIDRHCGAVGAVADDGSAPGNGP